MRALRVTVVFAAALLALLAGGLPTAGALSPQYLTIGNAKKAGQPIGCADVNWAAQQGLIEPVEVRWLSELGIRCPDATVPAEGVPSEQYVVMLALAARGQLTCADVEWNAANGHLTWSGAVNLAGLIPGCAMSPYAGMTTLLTSNRLSCADVDWNLTNGRISETQAVWLWTPLACRPPETPTPAPGSGCHPSYEGCLPIVRDLDCKDVPGPVRVIGPDVYRLDGDGDGIGCEAN